MVKKFCSKGFEKEKIHEEKCLVKKSTKIFENQWKTMKNNENQWKSKKIIENYWKSMKNKEKHRKTQEKNEKQWKTIKDKEKLWKTMKNTEKYGKTLKNNEDLGLAPPGAVRHAGPPVSFITLVPENQCKSMKIKKIIEKQ